MPEPDTPLAERPWENIERLLSVDEALSHVLAHAHPLPSVHFPLSKARGLVAAEDVVADNDVPPFTNSAMDGYAVRAEDTRTASLDSPIQLRVIGSVAAGEMPACAVERGSAVRIMTGAALPAGADAVVRFEETDEAARNEVDIAGVCIFRAAKQLDNVRPAGEDIRRDSVVLPAGSELGPAQLGVLASLGMTETLVHRRPRIGILSTGNEVVPPGDAVRPGQIYDSNSVTLSAMVAEAGGDVVQLGVVGDDMVALRRSLRGAVDDDGVDLLLTSGGVSVGDYDMVKDALQAEGEIAMWQVRIKPGKPLAFGVLGRTPLLGLPGNPVAAAVSFLQFARPAIRRMLGCTVLGLPRVTAALAAPVDNRGHRRHFVRVRLVPDGGCGYLAVPVGEQGAGILTSLAMADGLLIVPEEMAAAEAGERLPVELIRALPSSAPLVSA